MDLLGRYSDPDNVTRLNRILSSQGRDRPVHRPVPWVVQNRRDWPIPIKPRSLSVTWSVETSNALGTGFRVNRATVFAILQRAGIEFRAIGS